MGFPGFTARWCASSVVTPAGSACDLGHEGNPPAAKTVIRCLLMVVCVLWGAPGVVRAQGHLGQYAEADIIYGSGIYSAQCAQCHGPNGDLVGGVNLRSGEIKRAPTDVELRGILNTGIPGTAMPAFKFDATELTGIIAFVRNMRDFATKSVRLGDPARGKILYEGKGTCATCHRIGGAGARVGPNLSQIGSIRPASLLDQVLVDPTAAMLPQNRSIRAVTTSGQVVTGRRLNEDTYTVLLIDAQERLVALPKADLREYAVVKTSPMPSYKDTFTAAERADMLAYLLSLKGPKS
jgi:putative heme-binding domain-containing protein